MIISKISKKVIKDCNLKFQKLKAKMKEHVKDDRDKVIVGVFEQICLSLENTISSDYKKTALKELERMIKICK